METSDYRQIVAALRRANLIGSDPTPEQVLGAVTRMVDGMDALRERADLGRAYHAELVETALREGERAVGPGFPHATFKGVLERASIDEIEVMTRDWRRAADKAGKPARVPPAGRVADAAHQAYRV